MFTTSTQRRHWIFESPKHLDELRSKANQNYVEKASIKEENRLTEEEELLLLRSYLANMREFFRKFQPPVQKSVVALAFNYMKRFYLSESCMEYHPRTIGVTCAYLACKVDEFNVAIGQFIKNVKGDCDKAARLVLSNEMLLMQKLKFHLTVHLPYRAIQGFLIDLRARCSEARDKTELMDQHIDDYLEKYLFTDACFLYSPSQIALAAVYHGSKQCGVELESYIRDILFQDKPECLDLFRKASAHMRLMIDRDQQEAPSKETIKAIEKKMAMEF